jgi:hypothetical protein
MPSLTPFALRNVACSFVICTIHFTSFMFILYEHMNTYSYMQKKNREHKRSSYYSLQSLRVALPPVYLLFHIVPSFWTFLRLNAYF